MEKLYTCTHVQLLCMRVLRTPAHNCFTCGTFPFCYRKHPAQCCLRTPWLQTARRHAISISMEQLFLDPDPAWTLHSRKLLTIGGSGDLSPGQKGLYAVLCALFVTGSGLASGLTLGLMSLDTLELKVLLRSGSPKEQKLAARILPILSDPHWLLVTLLLSNAACFEALPIFLDTLVDPLGAILISITLILLFGEILPQAVCARHGLRIGVALSPLVRFMMWLFCPIAWPLARCLDWLLGKEGYTMFRRKQLKALVDLHGADEGLGGKLSDDEVQIICGALDLTNKVAYSAMTPLDKVVMLSTEQRIDAHTIATILASGHSRLPVYAGNARDAIVGLLLVKEILKLVPIATDPNTMEAMEPAMVSALNLRSLPRLPANTPMYALLKLFQTGRAHMVLLTQPEPSPSEVDEAAAEIAAADRAAAMTAPAKAATAAANHQSTAFEGTSIGKRRGAKATDVHTTHTAVAGSPPVATNGQADRTATQQPDAAMVETQPDTVVVEIASAEVSAAPTHVVAPPVPAITTVVLDGSPTHLANGAISSPFQIVRQAVPSEPAGSGDTDASARSLLHQQHNSMGLVTAVPDQHDHHGYDQSDVAEARLSNTGTPVHHKKDKHSHNSNPLGGLSRISARLSARLKRRRRSSATHTSSSSDSSSSSESGAEEEEDEHAAPVPQLARPGEPIGIITIEDVLEELMGQEILDESDAFADNERTVAVDEEMREQLAERLPEALRNLVLASATPGTIRRLSRTPLSRYSGGRANTTAPLQRTQLSGQGLSQMV